MGEERTRAMTQEEISEMKERQEMARFAKKTVAVGILVGAIVAFLMFSYNEWYHPYPNKYRVVTNGEVYKIQKKNWFFPWQIYTEFDGYMGNRIPRYYSEDRAKEAVKELEHREARRMRGKPARESDEWKPLD